MIDEYQISSIQPVLSSILTATSVIVCEQIIYSLLHSLNFAFRVCKIMQTAFSALKLIKGECLYWQARNWTKYKNKSFMVSLSQLYIAYMVDGWYKIVTISCRLILVRTLVRALSIQYSWRDAGPVVWWVGGCLTGTICLSRYFIYISSWQTRVVARYCMRENQYESIGELGTNIGWRTIGVLQIKSLPSGRQCC